MNDAGARKIGLAMVLSTIAALAGGCVYPSDRISERVEPTPVVIARPERQVVTYTDRQVVTYPEGRYELQGTAATGYYWVWVPRGTAVLAVPPPPRVHPWPAAAVVTVPPERVVVYPEGRYELHGSQHSGYYWVWIPTGAIPPPPPPLPHISQAP